MLRTARDFGLGLVERMPGLKQFFVAEAAGLTGDIPRLLRGERRVTSVLSCRFRASETIRDPEELTNFRACACSRPGSRLCAHAAPPAG